LARSESAAGAGRDLTREVQPVDCKWIEPILEKNAVGYDVLMDALMDKSKGIDCERKLAGRFFPIIGRCKPANLSISL